MEGGDEDVSWRVAHRRASAARRGVASPLPSPTSAGREEGELMQAARSEGSLRGRAVAGGGPGAAHGELQRTHSTASSLDGDRKSVV